jgi:hypothetical protein
MLMPNIFNGINIYKLTDDLTLGPKVGLNVEAFICTSVYYRLLLHVNKMFRMQQACSKLVNKL